MKHAWPARAFTVHREGEPSFAIVVTGRDRWALEALIAAGRKGCTPLHEPAPRWSAYVHDLRALGVEIETVTEAHGGPFAGRHGRYVLRDNVTPGRPGFDFFCGTGGLLEGGAA